MKVLVIIAGVADPKWPLPTQATVDTLKEHTERHVTLSPFDEAALELALKLRELHPGTTLHALVAGSELFARKVAEWRLDSVQRMPAGEVQAWDAQRFAGTLADAALRICEPSLVLLGREFGDLDDGAVPALVAGAMGVPHFSLGVTLAVRDGAVWATRQRTGSRMERVRLPARALLSVTNDPHNRLRHPLLKNVMAARRSTIPVVAATAGAETAALQGIELAVPARRGGACRMLTGSAAEQCAALAQVLLEEMPT